MASPWTRDQVLAKYDELRETHPALPQTLRPFQVDVLMEALDGKKNSNMLIAHPTGTGKSLPMLLLGLFLPEGSTTLIVPPLTTIEAQLLNDCERLGIPAVAGSKLAPNMFERAMKQSPRIVIANVEFLANSEVQRVLLASRLSPRGVRPIVCIDEAQVLDPHLGWGTFRKDYQKNAWAWLTAATRCRLLLLSGSMSECSLVKVADVLGVARGSFVSYFKNPARRNVFLQTIEVDKIESRTQDRTLGFLIPLAATGLKIQIFCQTLDVQTMAHWWLKRRLRELGLVDIPVMKISGLMSTSGKEDVMSNFCRSGGILVCTDVAAMGLNTPGLVLGVSLGIATTRWQAVQACGRLGRDLKENAVFITVYETKSSLRASQAEKEEFKVVQGAYRKGGCVRKSLYDSFTVDNATATYPDVPLESRCEKCYCCTYCLMSCGCSLERGNATTQVFQILGLDPENPQILAAEAFRKNCVTEELLLIEEEKSDEEEEAELSEEEEEGGDLIH